MKVDRYFVDQPPIRNDRLDDHFKEFPIYLRSHQFHYHRKKRHTQPGVEITFTHKGKAAYVVDHQVYMQSTGSLMIVPGDIPHQLFVDPNMHYKRSVICLDTRGLQSLETGGLGALLEWEWFASLQPHHVKLRPKVYTQLVQLVEAMQGEMLLRSTGWKRLLIARLMEMSVLLQRVIENGQEQTDDASRTLKGTETVEQCRLYIDRHLSDDLSLQRIAMLLGISDEHLTRLFQREQGQSYYQYVLMRRVEESKRLLVQFPEMPVIEIAHEVGFSSSAQFSRMFKGLTGLSPTIYRKTEM